jgi:hypothetical protein
MVSPIPYSFQIAIAATLSCRTVDVSTVTTETRQDSLLTSLEARWYHPLSYPLIFLEHCIVCIADSG